MDWFGSAIRFVIYPDADVTNLRGPMRRFSACSAALHLSTRPSACRAAGVLLRSPPTAAASRPPPPGLRPPPAMPPGALVVIPSSASSLHIDIQQMANVQYTENMTEEQVDAMAGSETLRQQASLFGATRNYKVLSKSTNRLRDSLLPKQEPKLAVPMLLLIAQHRSKIIINADDTYIKMVSEQFDRCHGILLHYVEFLSSAVTPTAYAQLIPPLQDLVHKYHIEPEVIFLLYRSVMCLFKSTNGGDTCWPLDDNEEGEYVSSDDLILHLDLSQEPIMWSDLLNTVQSILPTKAWNSLSPDLYATFWGLTLYDLHFPKDRYDTEIKKLHENLKQLEDNSDNSCIAISRRKKDKERIQDLLDKLFSQSSMKSCLCSHGQIG